MALKYHLTLFKVHVCWRYIVQVNVVLRKTIGECRFDGLRGGHLFRLWKCHRRWGRRNVRLELAIVPSYRRTIVSYCSVTWLHNGQSKPSKRQSPTFFLKTTLTWTINHHQHVPYYLRQLWLFPERMSPISCSTRSDTLEASVLNIRITLWGVARL